MELFSYFSKGFISALGYVLIGVLNIGLNNVRVVFSVFGSGFKGCMAHNDSYIRHGQARGAFPWDRHVIKHVYAIHVPE